MFKAALVLRGMDRKRLGDKLPDQGFCILLGALAAWNEALLCALKTAAIPFPRLYESGVRYEREPYPREEWTDAAETAARGFGDCEDLACWRVAELRVEGIDARPGFVRRRVLTQMGWQTIYHIVVLYPTGQIEDPSKHLGMNSIEV
ncbi:MAG: hypothetical protein IPK82_23320 [Polyangiaceae bacterium]|nr:hypothetical protein [Polyangiaceae bacterium]